MLLAHHIHEESSGQQVDRVTAAAVAIQANRFQPESLDEVASRLNALGRLARVFQEMARQVSAREQRWQQQVQQLRIQLDQAHTVREIVLPDREVK